jgi:hypothetical protein
MPTPAPENGPEPSAGSVPPAAEEAAAGSDAADAAADGGPSEGGEGGADAPNAGERTDAALPSWVETALAKARERGARAAAASRERHPGENPRQLGERMVKEAAFKAGLFGAATGTLSLLTLPVGLPAGVATTLYLEAELLFALLAVYGLDGSGEVGRARLAALWLGAGFADAAKSAGLRLGAEAAARALSGTLPARIIARLNPALVRAILKRLGMGWVPRAAKLWPILGAPIGFVIDRGALRALGKGALDTLDDVRRAAQKAQQAAKPAGP